MLHRNCARVLTRNMQQAECNYGGISVMPLSASQLGEDERDA